MEIIKAPNKFVKDKWTVYLAGSCGKDKWRDRLCSNLKEHDIKVINPRIDNYGSGNSKDPKFMEQVEWELQSMEEADMIAFYFDPKTESPITLLELGLFSVIKQTIIVCCPEGYSKKGNVDIVCKRHKNIVARDFDDFILKIKQNLFF